ncbi:MAG TPA: response regulator [Hyphomicrobiaceae bacterium]|nr:response regulator [Hyphomicrobiaceae bacterium]
MLDLIPIALIDDDPDVRESTRLVLLGEGIKADVYESATSFLQALPHHSHSPPRCIVSDVRMPGLSGLDLQQQLFRRGITVPLILITGHGDVGTAVAAMKAGAEDFIEKPFDLQYLVDAIRRSVSRAAEAEQEARMRIEVVERAAQLSARQHEVMLLVVDGYSNKQIAAKLGISARTVETYRLWVMEKMGAGSVAALVRMAMLLPPR